MLLLGSQKKMRVSNQAASPGNVMIGIRITHEATAIPNLLKSARDTSQVCKEYRFFATFVETAFSRRACSPGSLVHTQRALENTRRASSPAKPVATSPQIQKGMLSQRSPSQGTRSAAIMRRGWYNRIALSAGQRRGTSPLAVNEIGRASCRERV